MLNLFRGRGQQHPQAKDTQQATRLLPETPLIDEGMPSGIQPEGKVTVTLSSQFGSGGAEIGRIVAQECGLLYLDYEIIGEVARRLGVNVEQAARQDEQTVGTVPSGYSGTGDGRRRSDYRARLTIFTAQSAAHTAYLCVRAAC